MAPIRVMTFNVNGSSSQEGPNTCQNRAALNVKTIRR